MTRALAMPSDAELLCRFADGRSEEAFAELVRRHLDAVHSAALRQVGGDVAAAADVAQGVFIELARQASSLRQHPALIGWLHTTTHRLAARWVRTEVRRKQREREAHCRHEQNRPQAPETDWSRLAPVLDATLLELAEADRLVLLLRHLERRSHSEIGERLGVGENAARMRGERALDRLAQGLARRGITSTASALAVTLGQATVMTAPAGLAANVTAGALAAVGAVSAVGFWGFMASAKLKTIVAMVTAGVLGTGWWVQERRVWQAESQRDGAVQQLRLLAAELATLRLAAAGVSNELAQAQKVPDEVLRLRGEVARLRREGVRQVREDSPVPRDSRDLNLTDRLAGTVVSSTIPHGQLLLTGGWTSRSGKRVLVVVQHEVDNSGARPVITLSTTTLEADEDILVTKGFAEFLTPISEKRPQRFISPAEMQAMVDGSATDMTLSASPQLTTYSGRQGSLALTQDGSDVAMNFDLVPYLTADGGLQLTLIYGTTPVAP